MTFLMNEFDIETAVQNFAHNPETVHLGIGAEALRGLMEWANSNSDGWPYWRKPAAASKKLQEVLEAANRENWRNTPKDITAKELAQLLIPIKSFLTRQNADWREVL